jgi:hypothetical protein
MCGLFSKKFPSVPYAGDMCGEIFTEEVGGVMCGKIFMEEVGGALDYP